MLQDIKKSRDVFDFQSHTFGLHHKKDDKPVLLTLTKEEIIEDFNTIKKDSKPKLNGIT